MNLKKLFITMLCLIISWYNISLNSLATETGRNGNDIETTETESEIVNVPEADSTESETIDTSEIDKTETTNDSGYDEGTFELGEIIVGLRADASVPISNDLFPELNIIEIEDLSDINAPVDTYNIQTAGKVLLVTLATNDKEGVFEAIELLKENPNVEYAEPNHIYTIDKTPNDPSYSSLWGMAKISMPAAWDMETGSDSVKVGILDTGIDYNHPDLSGNVDVSLGYNAWADSKENLMDVNYVGHGSHVAGTVGAEGNNGIGVVGINWDVTMIPVKIGNDDNDGKSTDAALYRALIYAESINLDVVNISYSYFDGNYSITVEKGINLYSGLVVGSAGNSNKNLDNYKSYNCDNLILVANSTSDDTKWSSSSYGATTVDLFAPGTNIYSTIPGSKYNSLGGTSMAAPHVTGAAALLKAYDPSLSTSEIKEALINSVDKVPAFKGVVSSGGRLNVCEALNYISKDLAPEIAAAGNSDETKFTLTAKNIYLKSGVKSVSFAVWSESGGQDDLVWYNGSKNSSGVWTATVPINKHKTAGKYAVHVYATPNNGIQSMVGSTAFTVNGPSLESVTVQNVNAKAGTFDVIVKGVTSKSGVSKVEVPIWSASDQNDIVWYTAAKQSDGTYKVSVNISKHKYNYATYKIHVYITDGNGIFKICGATSQELTVPVATITASGNSSQKTYTLEASNVALASDVKSVDFAVWSESDGQDDLIWYSGSKNSSGVWSTTVPINKHKTAGRYIVHVYATPNSGKQRAVGTTTFTVDGPSLGSVTVQNVNATAGTFDVIVKGATSKSGVSKVEVPIWSAGDQNDIVWYTATKQSDGNYKVSVNISKHKNNRGTYKIHVYITDGNGIFKYCGATSQVIK